MSDDLLERIDAELAHAGEHHLDNALAALIGPPEWAPTSYEWADSYLRARHASEGPWWLDFDAAAGEDHTIERGDDYNWTIDHAAPGHACMYHMRGIGWPVFIAPAATEAPTNRPADWAGWTQLGTITDEAVSFSVEFTGLRNEPGIVPYRNVMFSNPRRAGRGQQITGVYLDEGFVPLGQSVPVGESWLTVASRAAHAARLEPATVPAALNREWAAWRNRFVLPVEPLPVPVPEPVGNPELRGIEPATWRDQLPPETGSARARRRRHERNMRRESQREMQRLNTEWSTR